MKLEASAQEESRILIELKLTRMSSAALNKWPRPKGNRSQSLFQLYKMLIFLRARRGCMWKSHGGPAEATASQSNMIAVL